MKISIFVVVGLCLVAKALCDQPQPQTETETQSHPIAKPEFYFTGPGTWTGPGSWAYSSNSGDPLILPPGFPINFDFSPFLPPNNNNNGPSPRPRPPPPCHHHRRRHHHPPPPEPTPEEFCPIYSHKKSRHCEKVMAPYYYGRRVRGGGGRSDHRLHKCCRYYLSMINNCLDGRLPVNHIGDFIPVSFIVLCH